MLDVPLYTAADAARALGIPAVTIRSWVRGRMYRTRGGLQQFERVILTPDDKGILSFRNIVELQVLRSLRVRHDIRIDVIRSSVRFMRSQLGIPHPLASNKMLHDGTTLFVNYLESLLDTSSGQVVLRPALEKHLERVEWNGDEPCRIYPFPAQGEPETRSVVLDPYVRSGQPVVDGTRIPLRVIVERHEAGDDIGLIAEDYGRTPGEIESVLQYAA